MVEGEAPDELQGSSVELDAFTLFFIWRGIHGQDWRWRESFEAEVERLGLTRYSRDELEEALIETMKLAEIPGIIERNRTQRQIGELHEIAEVMRAWVDVHGDISPLFVEEFIRQVRAYKLTDFDYAELQYAFSRSPHLREAPIWVLEHTNIGRLSGNSNAISN